MEWNPDEMSETAIPGMTEKTPIGVWQHRGAAPEQEDNEQPVQLGRSKFSRIDIFTPRCAAAARAL